MLWFAKNQKSTDTLNISRFQPLDMLVLIAGSCKIASLSPDVDNTTFYESIILQLRWRSGILKRYFYCRFTTCKMQLVAKSLNPNIYTDKGMAYFDLVFL